GEESFTSYLATNSSIVPHARVKVDPRSASFAPSASLTPLLNISVPYEKRAACQQANREHELNRRRHALRCRLGTMSALRSAQRWPGRPLLLGAAGRGSAGVAQ